MEFKRGGLNVLMPSAIRMMRTSAELSAVVCSAKMTRNPFFRTSLNGLPKRGEASRPPYANGPVKDNRTHSKQPGRSMKSCVAGR